MKLEALLRAYSAIARPIILQYFREDSCIASTRITLEVFRRFGFDGRELPVRLALWNKAANELAEKLGRFPDLEDFKDNEAWTVGCGWGRDPELDHNGNPKWPGHLVALIKGYLIDASASQSERRHKQIYIPDGMIIMRTNPLFLAGKERLVGSLPEGGSLAYEVIPRPDMSYKESSNWRETKSIKPIVEEILRELK